LTDTSIGAEQTDSASGVLETGVPNLDRVLGGGLKRGAIVMVAVRPARARRCWASRSASIPRGKASRSCT
jgi:replicative DNA helicase